MVSHRLFVFRFNRFRIFCHDSNRTFCCQFCINPFPRKKIFCHSFMILSFCISLRSFQGGFEYCQYEGVVSSAYQVFYPIVEIYDDYYKYLFKDKSFIEKMNSYTISFRDGKNIAFSELYTRCQSIIGA